MATWLDANERTQGPQETAEDREPNDRPPPLGTRVGRYILLRPVGEGGMGVVYAARDPELDRLVAIKLVRASGRQRASTRRARLLREAQALARLNHPNVVEVLDAGVVDARDWDPDADPPERVFIAMELVQADNLALWITKTRPSWRAVLDVFVAAGRGLHAAHRVGLVHRDFKPENVLVGPGDRVRVTDFGLARPAGTTEIEGEPDTAEAVDYLAVRLTRTGASIGTPAYMSPEQHRRDPVDARSDQFNFCVSLYEALYGRPPHGGIDRRERMVEVAAGRILAPPERSPVPPRVFRALARGLSPRPEDRFADMQALAEAIERATRRPFAWRTVLAAATGGSLAAILWIAWPTAAPPGCATDRDPIDEVWHERRAGAIEAAFAARPLSYARETWQRVKPQLRDLATAWSVAYRQACRTEDLVLRDVQMACLADRRHAIDALLEAFAAADDAVVRDAGARVSGLPSPSACTDATVTDLALPDDPALRRRIELVRATLARLDAQNGITSFAALIASAEQAVRDAEQIGWTPLHARALYRQGALQHGAARDDDAIATLTQAFFAAEQCGDAQTAADAAILLAYLHGAIRSDLDEGVAWSRHAAAAMQLLGAPIELQAELANALGEVYYRHGRYDDALMHHRDALAKHRVRAGGESLAVATALNNIGNVLYGRGDPQAAADHHAQALAIRQDVLGPNHPSVGAALNNLGGMLRLLGHEDDALAHLQRSLEILQAALGASHPDVAHPLNNLFLLHHDRGEWDDAMTCIERALAIWEDGAPDTPTLAVGLANLGLLHVRQGRPELALPPVERAVEIVERVMGPEHPNLAFSLATLGRTHLDLGDVSRARAALQRALPLREQQGSDGAGAAIVRARLAEADLRAGGDRDDAVARGESALAILHAAGPSWRRDAAEVSAWIDAVKARPRARDARP